MNEFIILEKDPYLSVLPIEVIAFHYSEPGACGYPGVLRMVTKDKRLFMIRWALDDWTKEDLDKVCPIMNQIHIGNFGKHIMPAGWNSIYMGLGNSLIFKDELLEFICERCKGMSGSDIYKAWVDIVISWFDAQNI